MSFLFVKMLIAQTASSSEILLRDKKIDSLKNLIQNSKEDTVKVKAIFELGILYDKNNNYNEVLSLGNQVLKLSQQINYKKGTGLANLLFSKYYRKKKNYDEALKYVFISLELLKKTDSRDGVAMCYDHTYAIYANLGDVNTATKYQDSAIMTWHELGNEMEEASMYLSKGVVSTYIGENGAALENHYIALNIYEKLGDQSGIASALGCIGFAYFGNKDDSLAIKYLEKASEIFKKLNDKFGYANNIMTIGDLYLRQGRHSDAMKYYKEGFEIFQLPGADKTGIPWSYTSFGRVYQSIGDSAITAGNPGVAEKNYNEALLNFSISKNKYSFSEFVWTIGQIDIRIGEVYYQLKKYKLSKKYILDGLIGLKNSNDNEMKAEAYLYLSRIDSIEGNFTKAYQHFQLHDSYHEKSLNAEKIKKVEVYKARDRIEQKEKEIKQLETENLLKTALAQKQKQQKVFAYAGIAIVLLLSGYGFYRYRRYSRLVSEQKMLRERLLISQDLHDNVGSTLSSISVFSKVAQLQSEENKKEELQEVLEKINITSGDMMAEMNDTVWAINPRNDSMEKIIQRMESFAKPLLATRNISFTLDYEPSVLTVNLGMEKRKNFYLIFKEAVNNAYKYSGCSEIISGITNTAKELELFIKDDGVGFDLQHEMKENKLTLSGNGLRNMEMRAKEMKGRLQINSIPGEGTEVRISIPIP